MSVKLLEMEGFLRGKCLPGDMKVRETNAEYLVRKFAELEQKLAESQREFRAADATIENLEARCAALAAEGAECENRMQQLIHIINNADNDYCMCGDEMKNHAHSGCGHPTGMFDYHYGKWLESESKTPATDAFLAEVRAQGVEAAIDTAKNVVAQEFQYKDFETAQRVCSKFPESDLVGKVEMVEWMADFAAQLRKGVQS